MAWIGFSQVGVTDLPLTVTFSAAMLLALPWIGKGDARFLPAASALLGLAVLAKYLLPLVLAVPLALGAAQLAGPGAAAGDRAVSGGGAALVCAGVFAKRAAVSAGVLGPAVRTNDLRGAAARTALVVLSAAADCAGAALGAASAAAGTPRTVSRPPAALPAEPGCCSG